VQDQLIFVVSPPRAGSTLLQRMLGAHPAIFTHPEPHLITPLAHLGYHDRVDAAPYDHINAAEAIRSFVEELPNGEADYLDALRAYADTMYGRMLSQAQAQDPKLQLFLDKTPAYALVLPFLAKLYPHAKYVVLTRHPLAVFSSYANSFYAGDWEAAHRFNPVIERYIPAMARFLDERPVALSQVAYEHMVAEPESALERLFAYLGLENDPDAVNYQKSDMKEGMGDPINVQKRSRPEAGGEHKWAEELAADSRKRALAEQMIAKVSDDDLAAWGYTRESLWAPLAAAGGGKAPSSVLNKYTVQRRVMLALRKGVNGTSGGQAAVRRLRYYCDVILRDQL